MLDKVKNVKKNTIAFIYLIWILSCIIFLFSEMFIDSKYDSVATQMLILSILMGSVSFSIGVFLTLIKLMQKNQFTVSRLLLVFIPLLLLVVGFVFTIPIFVGKYKSNPITEVVDTDIYIDCYIDGKLVKSSKETCKELSKICDNLQDIEQVNAPENGVPVIPNNTSTHVTEDDLIEVDVPNNPKHAYCEKEFAPELVSKIARFDMLVERTNDMVDSEYEEGKYTEIQKNIDEIRILGKEIDTLLRAYCYTIEK